MIRKGMWVVNDQGEIGIANAVAPDGTVEFHKVAPDGFTELAVMVHISALVQARFREIPEPRRTLTKEQFAALGYV